MNKGKALRSGNEDRGKIKVVCIPLFSILLALGNPVVDYFSLDTEGADFEILKVIYIVILFFRIDIDVLAHVPKIIIIIWHKI